MAEIYIKLPLGAKANGLFTQLIDRINALDGWWVISEGVKEFNYPYSFKLDTDLKRLEAVTESEVWLCDAISYLFEIDELISFVKENQEVLTVKPIPIVKKESVYSKITEILEKIDFDDIKYPIQEPIGLFKLDAYKKDDFDDYNSWDKNGNPCMEIPYINPYLTTYQLEHLMRLAKQSGIPIITNQQSKINR